MAVKARRANKPSVAPDIGAHTREVLGELGYSREAIEELIRCGAVSSPR